LIAGAVSLGGVAAANAATGASRLEVRGGTLTLVKAPEPTVLQVTDFSGRWGVTGDDEGFEAYSGTGGHWPGLLPAPGPGCAADAGYEEYSCHDVTAVDLAGGDGTDLLEVSGGLAPVPIRLIGNGGRDGLLAWGRGDVQIDGGAGDDVLALKRGVAVGGPGDDLIRLDPVHSTRRSAQFAPTRIDCGPGHDELNYYAARNRRPPPATVDRASCPAVITPLRRYFPQFPGDYRQVKLPRSRRLHLTILRTPEALHGTLKAEKGSPSCTRPKRVQVGAGGTLRATIRITANGVRRSRSNSRAGSYCSLVLSATDPQGDRVVERLPFLIRPSNGGTPPRRRGR
jgi:hypothetical protein